MMQLLSSAEMVVDLPSSLLGEEEERRRRKLLLPAKIGRRVLRSLEALESL
jgi:hypothetical protein